MKKVNFKKVVGVLGVVILVLGITIFCVIKKERPAQEVTLSKSELPEQASENAEEKEPKLIWQKKFEEEIVDMVVGYKKIEKIVMKEGKKVKVEEEILYPKVVVTKKAIKFLDEKSEQKKKHLFKKWSTVNLSRDGKYLGISTATSGEKDEIIKGKFTMMDSNGKMLWQIDNVSQEDIVPSPTGQYAVGFFDGCEWPPVFYSSEGIKMNEKWPRHLEQKNLDFSGDGSVVALTITDRTNRKREKGYLILFNNRGNELWRRETGDWGGRVKVSDDGKLIAAVTSKKSKWGRYKSITLLFNNKGNLLWETTHLHSPDLIFSADGKYLFAPSVLYETKTGNIVWEYEDIRGDPFATPNLEFIIVTGHKWKESKIVADVVDLLNKKGEKLWHEEFGPWYITIGPYPYPPHINISPDGEKILIGTKDGIKVFQNPFAK